MTFAAYRNIVGAKEMDEATMKWVNYESSVEAAGLAAMVTAVDQEIANGVFRPVDRSWTQHLGSLFSYPNTEHWTSYSVIRAAESRAKAARDLAELLRREAILKNGEAARLVDEAIRKARVEFAFHGWDVFLAQCGWQFLLPWKWRPELLRNKAA
jgi:hypothetical protein